MRGPPGIASGVKGRKGAMRGARTMRGTNNKRMGVDYEKILLNCLDRVRADVRAGNDVSLRGGA
jgi:hypothetical protein